MREFFRTYETAPDILREALLIGWTQNVVIMEADLSMDQRHWYLRAALQFRWSKAELLRQISDSAHEQTDFVVSTGTGNIDCDEPEQERQGNEDSSCRSQHNLQETNDRVCNEKSGVKVCDGEVVLHFRSCYQSGSNRQSGLSGTGNRICAKEPSRGKTACHSIGIPMEFSRPLFSANCPATSRNKAIIVIEYKRTTEPPEHTHNTFGLYEYRGRRNDNS